MSKNIFSDRKN